MNRLTSIPRIPEAVGRFLALLPKGPLQAILARLGRRVAARHPALFTRLGLHADKRFLVSPTDLPFAFIIRPAGRQITVVATDTAVGWDSRIAGSFAALLGLVHGAYDGDGLFFCRDLTIEGDVEAVLALRNALDDAELDLLAELAESIGPPGRLAARALRPPARAFAGATGIALLRTGEIE